MEIEDNPNASSYKIESNLLGRAMLLKNLLTSKCHYKLHRVHLLTENGFDHQIQNRGFVWPSEVTELP